MFKKMNCKKSIICLTVALMLLLSACNVTITSDEKPNSNGTLTSNPSQSETQNGSSNPDGTVNKPSGNGDTIKPDNTNSETLEEVKAVHIDKDYNRKCDKCNESVLVYIDLFAVNDLHGKITDSASQPGVDELTS